MLLKKKLSKIHLPTNNSKLFSDQQRKIKSGHFNIKNFTEDKGYKNITLFMYICNNLHIKNNQIILRSLFDNLSQPYLLLTDDDNKNAVDFVLDQKLLLVN